MTAPGPRLSLSLSLSPPELALPTSLPAATVRVGVDLVAVNRIARSLERFGERFVRRVFTDAEAAYCRCQAQPAGHFAARFAAKEAAMKVLRPAAADALNWNSIEVQRFPGGWCQIVLYGAAADLARRAGVTAWSVSLTHEADYAAAVVLGVLQCSTATARERPERNEQADDGRADPSHS